MGKANAAAAPRFRALTVRLTSATYRRLRELVESTPVTMSEVCEASLNAYLMGGRPVLLKTKSQTILDQASDAERRELVGVLELIRGQSSGSAIALEVLRAVLFQWRRSERNQQPR